MAKLLIAVVFSVLLLVPVGAQQVFATHLTLSCPPGGIMNINPSLTLFGSSNYCVQQPSFTNPCTQGYSSGNVLFNGAPFPLQCASPLVGPGILTPAGSCQNGAVLDANDHCVPDFPNICSTGTVQAGFTCIAQAMGSMIGGTLLETNTVSLLVGSIGVNPVITGLVGITIAGIVGQTAWFVHRRKKSEN